MQVAERHWNAHAFINIAALVNVGASEGKELSPVIKSARIVFGYPSLHEGLLCAAMKSTDTQALMEVL